MDTRSLLLTRLEEQAGGVDNGGVDNGGVDNGGVDNGGRDVSIVTSDGAVVSGVNGNGESTSRVFQRRSPLGFRELAARIEERIQDQTCSRVRNLDVSVTADGVVLQGRCATFYTKQLAQHAAMGVLEEEVLVNNIFVVTAR